MSDVQEALPTDEEAMAATWDRLHSETPVETPTETPAPSQEAEAKPEETTSETRERDEQGRFVAKQPSEEAEASEETAETVEQPENDAPSILPKNIRDRWGDLDAELKTVLTDQQTRMSQALAEAGKQKQAIGPIYDKVLEAAKEFPQLAEMQPGEIANEVFELARWASSLQQDPVGSLLSMAEQHGATNEIRQRLGGPQQPQEGASEVSEVAALKEQITGLQGQIQQLMDPSRISEAVTQQVNQNSVQSEVQAFAASKPDWAAIEPQLHNFIPVAQEMHPEGSTREVLETAYEMASYALPNTRTRLLTERETRAAQERATAVNVNSQGTAGSAELTEDQLMNQVWAKHYGG